MALREQNRQRTRARILRVCERLFRRRGFDATTVDEIARQARVSRQTFFNYFPGKQAALAELGFEWLRAQSEAGAERAGSPAETIRGVMRRQLRAIEADREFMRLVFTRSGLFFPHGPQVGSTSDEPRLERTRLLFELVAGAVRSAQAAGEIRADADPLQVAEVWVSVMFVTVRLWLTDYWQSEESLETRALRALDLLVGGLAPRAEAG